MNPTILDPDQYFRHNKWDVRVMKRGTDYDTAEVVKCLGFPDEKILGRGLWPDHANTICEEHNDSLARILFQQVEEAVSDQCSHESHDHGICLECGSDVLDELVRRAEDITDLKEDR